jgi:hypothetical protein
VSTDSVTDQYVFQMNLLALPSTTSDNLPLYGIYLGGPPLSAPGLGSYYPTGFSSSVEVFYMVWGTTGAFYNLPRGSSVSASFNLLQGQNTLEWRVNTGSITSSSQFYGATSRLTDGYVFDTTAPAAVTPIPAAAWLLGSGLIGLIGIKRKDLERFVDVAHSSGA